MKRAVGIIRVSHVGGRKGERFISPEEQRERIENVCKRDGLQLVAVHEELDVSGGRTLAARPGLSAAVTTIEEGHADVLAAAYFDRLFRSLATQAEVVERVERAGGQVLAVDVGQVTSASAGQWLSSTMMGAVSEYYRRSMGERSREGQVRAVARGAIMWSRVPLGYDRGDDAILIPNEAEAKIVRSVFEQRAEGASYLRLRRFLKEQGVSRTVSGVKQIIASRVYLGEIHFGELVNSHAHPPIMDAELWGRAQRAVVPRGPSPKSDALLARLGVLVCGNCGSRMCISVLNLAKQGRYPTYTCRGSDCPRRLSITAEIVESMVVSAVQDALRDLHSRASMAESAQEAVSRLSSAQDDLDTALRVFSLTGAENEPAAVERLTSLRAARDEAQARVDQIGPEASRTVTLADDWDDLSLDGRRALIRATVARVVVAPVTYVGRGNRGRAAERITIHLVGEEAASLAV